jgi:mRNA-degrading endonuclease RelE of RelBE toxin-antitoxin system
MKFEILITDTFKRRLKRLKKKYPHITVDLQPVLEGLETGESMGVPIPGLFNRVYKVRCASSDMQKGKSGGFRIIHYLEGDDGKIYLLVIYAKAEQEDIPVDSIKNILKGLDLKVE